VPPGTTTVSWSSVSDPDADTVVYELYLDTSNPPATLAYSGSSTSASVSTSDGTIYYWRVRAYDGYGYTTFSPVWWFGADGTPPPTPALQAPSNGAQITATPVNFDWSDVTDFSNVSYEIEITPGGTSTTPASNYSAVLADGTYTWRVRAVDGPGNTSAWTSSWWFELDSTPPPTPTLLTPADGAQLTNGTVDFDWSDVTDPNGVTYQIEISPIGTFPTTASAYTTTLADGVYSWRVRALDGFGNASSWSPWRSFAIETVAPPQPTLLAPADGAQLTNSTVDFDWSDVSDPNGVTYEIEIAPGGIFATASSNYSTALADGT
jgi:predicted phage tail protein